jgi:Tfp pilus assembly ATPase PilU
MDESIVELLEAGKISLKMAMKNIERKKNLNKFISVKKTGTEN